jgi:hypothetical protein
MIYLGLKAASPLALSTVLKNDTNKAFKQSKATICLFFSGRAARVRLGAGA